MDSEFESVNDNQALKEAIVAHCQSEGGITFRDFMEMALYHPHMGYYTSPREKIGREGDYLTSPVVSHVFGAMVGRQLLEMWQIIGQPPRFQVVEAGAGTGALSRDVLRWAHRSSAEFLIAIEYVILERSPALAARQRDVIGSGDVGHKVRWANAMPEAIEGCILTNELLDSMPVHRLAVENGRLQEVFVVWDGIGFVEELRPSSPELEAYFATLKLMPGEGCRAEVNLAALSWMREAGAALRRGFLLTFDYGYEADELYAPWRRDGTLLCFYRHNPSDNPYARIGRQDMTSHIDFTSLRRVAEDGGLSTLGIVPQAEFLTSLGIAEVVAPPAASETDLEGYYSRRRAVMELLDPAGLGRIRALVQTRGLTGAKLRGLSGDVA